MKIANLQEKEAGANAPASKLWYSVVFVCFL